MSHALPIYHLECSESLLTIFIGNNTMFYYEVLEFKNYLRFKIPLSFIKMKISFKFK